MRAAVGAGDVHGGVLGRNGPGRALPRKGFDPRKRYLLAAASPRVTSCESPWTQLIMLTAMLVVPFGVPMVMGAALALVKAVRWPLAITLSVATVGFLVFARIASDYPGGVQWLQLLFLAPLALGGLAVALPRPWTRLLAVLAACVPPAGAIAYGLAHALDEGACPAF